MKKRNKISSFWLSAVIALLLSIFLTMAGYLGGIYFGFFNKSLFIDCFNKTSYYNSIMEYTIANAESLAIPIGLQPEVFQNVFTLDETSAEGKALLKADLEGVAYTPDASEAKERLISNINLYLQQQNISINSEQQANITTFANLIAEEYTKNLSVPYIKYYVGLRDIVMKLVYIGMPVLLVLIIISIVLLTKLQTWFHRTLRFIAYSTIAATLMTAIFPIYLLANGDYKNMNISPEYFLELIVDFITQSLVAFLYVSLFFAILSVAIIIMVYVKRKKASKKKYNSK